MSRDDQKQNTDFDPILASKMIQERRTDQMEVTTTPTTPTTTSKTSTETPQGNSTITASHEKSRFNITLDYIRKRFL